MISAGREPLCQQKKRRALPGSSSSDGPEKHLTRYSFGSDARWPFRLERLFQPHSLKQQIRDETPQPQILELELGYSFA
jgi:hypothetical protein